jgi:hypothetical protein
MTVAGSLAGERTHLVPTMQSFLAALFFLVFTVAQVREGAALDVGVSGGAVGLGAGASAGVGSGGLSAGAGLSSGGIGASASGSFGPSGVGGGANTGAVGASANAGVGSNGVSAGGGTSTGSSGASVGGSVGPSGIGGALGVDVGAAGATANAGIGANSVSVGGSLSGAGSGGGTRGPSGGAGLGSGGNGTPAGGSLNSVGLSTNGSAISGVSSDGTGTSVSINVANPEQRTSFEPRTSGFVASIAPTALATSSLAVAAVPRALLPVENGRGDSGWFRSIYLLRPLRAKPGTSLSVVQSCRNALVPRAVRYGATHVDVASAGRTVRLKGGGISAPVEARILFQRGNHIQVRQARITCRLDQAGRIIAMF